MQPEALTLFFSTENTALQLEQLPLEKDSRTYLKDKIKVNDFRHWFQSRLTCGGSGVAFA